MSSNSTSAHKLEKDKVLEPNGNEVLELNGNEVLKPDDESSDYNPCDHRNDAHLTTDLETLAHLVKAAIGSGILSLPYAFSNCGLWNGFILSFIIGGVCLYCIQMLIKNSHILCRRARVPFLDYADIVYLSFSMGPSKLKKWSRTARIATNTVIITSQFGICCVYNVFIAENVRKVFDYYELSLNVRWYMVIFTVPLILLNSMPNLKMLSKFSMISIIFIGVTLLITLNYIFKDLPPISERPFSVAVTKWPIFIGTLIFSIEGVGVVIPLENKMKNPSHMIGWKGILTFGWGFAVFMYASFGFLGYWRYGDSVSGSISLDLPPEDKMAQAARVIIAIAILLTYPLQMYAVFDIVWKNFHRYFPANRQMLGACFVRTGLVIASIIISIIVPTIGPFVALVGAVGLNTLGLIFPPFIEIIVNWEKDFGQYYWRIWKDAFFLLFGIFSSVVGTYISIQDIIRDLGDANNSDDSNKTLHSSFAVFRAWKTTKLIKLKID